MYDEYVNFINICHMNDMRLLLLGMVATRYEFDIEISSQEVSV